MSDGTILRKRLQSVLTPRAGVFLVVLTLALFGCAEKKKTPEEVLAEARATSATGKLGEAISMLELFDRESPGNFEVVEQLAFFYGEADDSATSAMFFARAAEIDPSQAEHLLFAAQAWENAGDIDSAINLYQQYILARPDDYGARHSLSDFYYLKGDLDEARNTLLRSNRLSPNSGVQVRLGELFLESGNLALAQQWFDSAARFGDENRDEALLGLLEVVIRGNRFADADQLLTVIDEEFPGRLEESSLAPIRPQLNRWRTQQQAAVAAAEQLNEPRAQPTPPAEQNAPPETSPPAPPPAAIAEAPVANDATAQATQARTQANAPEQSEGSARSPDRTPPGENAVGQAETGSTPPDKEERVARVEAGMATFVRPEPSLPEEGPLSLFPGDSDTSARNVLEVLPTGSDYTSFLAQARAASADERYAEAIKLFHRALARSSSDPAVWSELSEAQRLAGENRTALASASEAIRRAPDQPGFRLQYLRVAESNLQPNALIEEMEKARRDFPLQPEFTLLIARVHRELGNLRFARRYYEDFLRLAPPTHPEFANAEGELSAL